MWLDWLVFCDYGLCVCPLMPLAIHGVAKSQTRLNWICLRMCYISYSAAAAAAAKSLQSCRTLCDPMDGNPPGSPVPEILQARTLEWVAISLSNAWKWKVKVKLLSRVWLLVKQVKLKDLLVQLSLLFIMLLLNKLLKRIVHVYCFWSLYSTSFISILAPATLSQDCHTKWSVLNLHLAWPMSRLWHRWFILRPWCSFLTRVPWCHTFLVLYLIRHLSFSSLLCSLLFIFLTSLYWRAQTSILLQCQRPGFDSWVGKIPLEKGTAIHSSILAWRISWTEEPGRLQSMGLQRVRHN